VTAAAFRLTGFAWLREGAYARSAWNFGFGLACDREFRWANDVSSVLSAEGGISVGPAVMAIRKFERRNWYEPVGVGTELRVPATGALTSGFAGADGALWGEWHLGTLGKPR